MTVTMLGRRLPATATYAVAIAIGVLLVMLIVGGALWVTETLDSQGRALRSSFQTRSAFRYTLSMMQDAETGQRGYLLTGDQAYLQPYNTAVANAPRLLASLDDTGVQNPALREPASRMKAAAQTKLEELQRTIDLMESGRRAEAMRLVRSNSGKAAMDEARAIVESVFSDASLDLSGQIGAAQATARTLRAIVLSAAIALLALALLIILTVRQGWFELRASRDAAERANANLMAEIDRRQATEAKMLHMQKMEAIGQLTGGVAHDFNNMLAVIMSALTLLQRRLNTTEGDIKMLMDGALDGARRAATLTHRLLAFARRAPLEPTVIDANKMVAGMSDLLRRTLGEQVALETVLAGGLWRAQADPSQLENAIVNICVNARDAMKDGGKLTIETANAFLDEKYAAANIDVKAGQYVLIAVTDTGAGMSPDVAARAFEPFFTTKGPGSGTGLGLSHVHGFVKQTGGHVAIYTEIGQGTTIKLYLPRTQRAEEEASEPASSAEAPRGDLETLVLVVEDDDRVRALSVASLRELGYTVIHAPNGATALQTLERNPAVALLFTDIVMPGMSGRQLVDKARETRRDLKVLYTTGYTQNAIVHNGVVDADARLLNKPYSIDELARKVRAVLDEK